jgi:hypothetical protein
MNKYIKEKGIIVLIESYVRVNIEEIFKIAYDIQNKLYFGRTLEKEREGLKPEITIYALTNDSFVVFECVPCEINSHAVVSEKKITDKKLGIKLLKDSTIYDPLKKYIDYLDFWGDEIEINADKMHTIFKCHDIETYNLNLLVYTQKMNQNMYITKESLIDDIENMIPKKYKRNTTIKCSRINKRLGRIHVEADTMYCFKDIKLIDINIHNLS